MITCQELQRRLIEAEDVSPEEAAPLLSSPDRNVRLAAQAALTKTRIRQALEATADLAKAQGYAEQGTLGAVDALSKISDNLEPYIETLKQLGLQAASQGNFELAMRYLQNCVSSGAVAGQRRGARARRAMRYVYDEEIGKALATLAKRFPPPNMPPPGGPSKLLVIASALADEDAPSYVTLKRTQCFRDYGFNVTVMTTGQAASEGTNISARLTALNVPIVTLPNDSWTSRVQTMIAYCTANPQHAAFYSTVGPDNLAKLAACIGLAPVQVWDNKGMEPNCGKFDVVAQALSVEQETKTAWPGVAKYYGTPVAAADEIEAAEPFTRAQLGLPQHAIVLGTFGRMEKCISPEYMNAIVVIMQREPRAHLLLAGPDNFNNMNDLLAHFAQNGLADRVHYLGRRQADSPRLVKSIDIYCDTYPWPGGQIFMDAMQAGVPIVAMRRAMDKNLDATGAGVTAVADIVLGDVIELAAAGSVEDYVRIAMRYIADPAYRAEVGGKEREKALRDCSMQAATFRIADDIKRLVAEKTHAAART